MREYRKIKELKKEEYSTLKDMARYCLIPNVRPRAHAVLLNAKGYSIDEISDIFDVDRDTISIWLTNWEKDGLGGLYNEPRSGRPPIIDEKDFNIIKNEISKNPRSLKVILEEVKKN